MGWGVTLAVAVFRPGWGDPVEPHAQVVLKPGASGSVTDADLREHCRERLAAFKVPARIRLVRSLQRTASGKVLRRKATSDA